MTNSRIKPDTAAKRKRWTRAMDLLGSALFASLLTGSLMYVLLGALGLPVTMRLAYTASFVSCAVVSLLSMSRLVSAVTMLVLGVTVYILNRLDLRPWMSVWELFRALIAAENGVMAAFSAYPSALAAMLCLLLGALLYGMARMHGGVYPAITIAMIVFLASWYLGSGAEPLPAALTVVSLAAFFSRCPETTAPWRRVLPSVLIVALAATALVPPAGTIWPPLADAAQKTRDLVDDYLRFNTPRFSYTVATDGWQSLGDRLGGPANPQTTEIMTVQTDRPVLLRGSTKRSYTTYSWVDTGRYNRYLYFDPTKAALRASLFASGLDAEIDLTGAFRPVSTDVLFLTEGSSSLFVPDILETLSAPVEMAVYFNDIGELFLTRNVAVGDSYTASGYAAVHGAALSAVLENASALRDDRYESIRAEYTALPDGIHTGVRALANTIVGGAGSPYEAATMINDYLRSGAYRYATDVSYPPHESDFVSYFLLNSKEGYCTYFASAMAVMARMVGLPSRYVEGYLAVPDENGVAVVTGEDAHAWVEIYFRGAGWITFDPTPGNPDTNPDGDGTAGGDAPDATPEPSADDAPTPSPEPTSAPDEGDDPAQPEETPTPEYTEPTPPPGADEPATPPPQEQPDSMPDDSAASGDGENEPPIAPWLWKTLLALALLAVVVLLVRLRDRSTSPAHIAKRAGDTSDQLMVWYRALIGLLEAGDMLGPSSETPMQIAARLAAVCPSESLVKFLQVVTVCRYGKGEPNESAVALAASACADVERLLSRRQRARWNLRRMTKGIGDWKRIP